MSNISPETNRNSSMYNLLQLCLETLCKDKCLWKPIKKNCSASELQRSYPVSKSDLNSLFQWMLCTEGFNVSGYCPTTASGLTVGAGVDFGQQSTSKSFKDVGTPSCLLSRIVPFIGAKCQDECFNPRFSTVVKLCLTKEEAVVLTKGFMAKALAGVIPYSQQLDTNARDSLTSIHYWAGYLSQKYKTTFTDALKLCVPDSSGKMVNFLWSAIKGKNAKQADVLSALNKMLNAYEKLKYKTGISRIGREIRHIQGTEQCQLSIDQDVCNKQICTICDLKAN